MDGKWVAVEEAQRRSIPQVLVVTSGTGWVQEWGGARREIRPGDVIWTPPGVKHWHGASQEESVRHLALSFGDTAWQEPVEGLRAIADLWESERDGAHEPFAMTAQVVAVDGDTAVVRVHVDYHDPDAGRWRDLWVLRFADDGRCAAFEEWPFAPDQADGH